MRAVITVIGHDTVGIIASVSEVLSQNNVNILDISQSVLQDLFAMVMLADISDSRVDLKQLTGALDAVGEKLGVKALVMHEDIFNSMHRI